MTNVDDSVGPELLFAIQKEPKTTQTPSPRLRSECQLQIPVAPLEARAHWHGS